MSPGSESHRALQALGWDEERETAFEPLRREGLEPARVAVQHRTGYGLLAGDRECFGEVSGRFFQTGFPASERPVVGDWVAASLRPTEGTATITEVLERRTWFSRKVPGDQIVEQVLAANLDRVFVVSGLDRDFNPRRIERYITLVTAGSAEPVILLNKADLTDELDEQIEVVRSVAPGVPVVVLSALEGEGLEELQEFLQPATTAALVGSSGVGKSTIINQLVGEELLPTAEVRAGHGKGRHTTTRRELIQLPGGALLIDTPGLRELQLWGDEEALRGSFPEIERLGRECRFRDCRHEQEPGCAVLAAVESGELSGERLESWRRQQREMAFQIRKLDPERRDEENKRIARIQKQFRKFKKKP